MLWYDKSLVAGAGIAFPDDTWSWDDLHAAAMRISRDANGDGVNDIWGMRTDLDYPLFDTLVKSYGGLVLTPDRRSAAINSAAAAEATRFLRTTIESGAASPAAAVADGSAAFQVGGSWLTSRLASIDGLDWGVAITPKGPAARSVYGGSNQWEVVYRPSQDLNAVWTILKELVGREAMEAYWSSYNLAYGLPAVRSVAEEISMNEVQQVLIASVPFMHDADTSPDWAEWQAAKRNEIMPALLGERSVEESLARAALAIDVILANAFGGSRSGGE